MTEKIKITDEEKAFLKSQLNEFRAKKQQYQELKQLEVELELPEVKQEIFEEHEPENVCSNCGYKFDGRLERCPKCDVEFDWG